MEFGLQGQSEAGEIGVESLMIRKKVTRPGADCSAE